MRWKARTWRRVFLFIPRKIGDETVWLEWVDRANALRPGSRQYQPDTAPLAPGRHFVYRTIIKEALST